MMNKYRYVRIIDDAGNYDAAAADAWAASITSDDIISSLGDIAQIIAVVDDVNSIAANMLRDKVYQQAKAVCGTAVGTSAGFGRAIRAAYERVQQAADNGSTEHYNSRQYLSDCPVKVQTGNWRVDSKGVHKTVNGLEHYAATHPIVLTGITAEQATGTLNYELAYRDRAGKWCTIVVDKKTASDAKDIINKLSPYDTGVTGKHGYDMVDYLAAIADSNPDMTIATAIDALGVVDDYAAIAPYHMGDYKLSPTIADNQLVNYYGTAGDADIQIDCLRRLRSYNRINAVLMDAMLSSMAMPACAGHTYIINPYAATSTGKSALAAVCASLYGYCGQAGNGLVQNYNQSAAYQQTILGNCHTVPVIYDDVKSADDDDAQHRLSPYNMCSGASNGRNRRVGVSERVRQWDMVIMMPCEYPICDDDDTAGGAQARVLNIPIDPANPPVDVYGKHGPSIHDTLVDVLYSNYGWPAKMMADALCRPGVIDGVRARYRDICRSIDTTYNAKHVESIATIIAVSELADDIIWHTGNPVTVSEMLPYIKKQTAISEPAKQYDALQDWVDANSERFYSIDHVPSYGVPLGRINGDGTVHIVVGTAEFKAWAVEHGWTIKNVRANLARDGKLLSADAKAVYFAQGITKRCITLVMQQQ